MKIMFLPHNIKVESQDGENLLQAAYKAGIDLNAVCAGNGTCGKCKVLITKGNNKELNNREKEFLTEEEIDKGIRLACFFEIKEDTCVVIEQTENKFQDVKINSTAAVSCHNRKCNAIGVAFDIGTTSVEAALYDLESGKILSNKVKENPQRIYGADVISRVTYCIMNEDGLIRQHKLILSCCNDLIQQMLLESGMKKQWIQRIAVAGNTIMTHIFAGKNVDALARVPFHSEYKGGVIYTAKQLDFNCNPDAKVYLPALIGGHVGTDTLGCIIETGIYNRKGTYLIVDVGTNGEIVLAKDGKLAACSTAAGPAFEGASIQCGMRAESGAIYEAKMEAGVLKVTTVQDTPAKGICGSGLIDIVAELLRQEVIDETGRLEEDYILTGKEANIQVKLVQKDVRELQLAKAAIYTGIQFLLKHFEVNVGDLDGMYMAGAFGSHLNIPNAVKVGLLPEISKEKVFCIGNASLAGMGKIVTQELDFEIANQIGWETTHLELAEQAGFTDFYIDWINFTS